MPPKRAAARSAPPPPPPSSSSARVEVGEKKSDAATLRKLTSHPPTIVMVREALKVLDSRKGASSQAIQKYIKVKYPSADGVRLKHFVRRALIKGIESGALVRPPNSTITSGALGRFRLPPKMVSKPKSENTDPNVPKAPKAAKDEVKRPQKAGGAKKNSTASGEVKPAEDPMPPRKAKKDEKPAPVKKPKAKKAEANGSEGSSDSTKAKATDSTKATKTTRPKTAKASQGKAVKADGDAPVAKSAKQKTK
ncbi:sperm-specific protein PHI-2B [Nematolebias whitei]|uniref:sperm-specific protein PHI-2B n=1 Tax=Nematolebias whitei TaxID=451745 RepID=UPI00189B45CA|nr:sperm-specific protein PHI-2B [Nematolebias whitei]